MLLPGEGGHQVRGPCKAQVHDLKDLQGCQDNLGCPERFLGLEDSWLGEIKGQGLLWKERSKIGKLMFLWLGLESERQPAW